MPDLRPGGRRTSRPSYPRCVEGALQRLHVTFAGHGAAADHVDVRALGRQRVLHQDRNSVGVDLLVLGLLALVLLACGVVVGEVVVSVVPACASRVEVW